MCLNVGCIPSKALLRNAEIAHLLTHEKEKFGIVGETSMDFSAAWKRSRDVMQASERGVHFLMKKNAITEISGADVGHAGRADLTEQFGRPTSIGVALAIRALAGALPEDQIRTLAPAYVDELVASFRRP